MTAITNFNHETFVNHMNRVVDRKIKDPIKNDLMKKSDLPKNLIVPLSFSRMKVSLFYFIFIFSLVWFL